MSRDTNEHHRHDSIATSECSFSLSGESTYMETLVEKEKRELVEECIWLRESSKGALQKSWDEVESLQRQCRDHNKVEKQLTAQLNDIQADKEIWRLRCLAAEEIQVMPSEPNKSPKDMPRALSSGNLQEKTEIGASEKNNNIQQTYDKSLMTFRDKIRSWSSGNLSSLLYEPGKVCRPDPSGTDESCRKLDRSVSLVDLHDSNTSDTSEDYLEETLVQTSDAPYVKNVFYINGNSKSQEDLSLIISSRDQIISNLEQTINQQLPIMQNLEDEMQRVIEAQCIKEERLCSSHKQNEDHLKKVIKYLQERLNKNEETAKKYDKSLSECKLYIQELAGELEKMLKIIKIAEEGGYIIDQNLSS